MAASHPEIALALSRQRCVVPCLLWLATHNTEEAQRWRSALREFGVPVLELNGAVGEGADRWLVAATELSDEFLTPVVVLGAYEIRHPNLVPLNGGVLIDADTVDDTDWLNARHVALTRVIETSVLNQEFRRTRERQGWIRLGWQPETALVTGNGLVLAWSSPLPLRRIRDFAARCPELTLIGADAEALAAEVAAQGISASGWRFAVK